jgi:CMP-N,N'-diacetyllegionaminic acid synthase
MKKICFDIDGVICKTLKSNYELSKPDYKAIKIINKLYDNGNYIIIFTARYMGRNNQKISKAKKQGYKLTFNQLKKWNVKFHKLIFGKPSYDIIIDDRSFSYSSNWKKKL